MLRVVTAADLEFEEKWCSLVATLPFYRPVFDPIWDEYYRLTSLGVNYIDQSLLIMIDDVEAFGVRLFTSEIENAKRVDAIAKPAISVVNPQVCLQAYQKQIKKILERYVESFLTDVPQVWYWDLSSGPIMNPLTMILFDNGYPFKIKFKQIIDLRVSVGDLFKNIRKSYKSLISKRNKELEINFIFGPDARWDDFLLLRDIHVSATGRETRSIESWREQFDRIKSGHAFALIGNYEGFPAAGAYFIRDNYRVFYGVSATKKDFIELSLMHTLIWNAISFSQGLGLTYFDIGEIYPLREIDLDPKVLSIGAFKRGFGGQTIEFKELFLKNSKD